MLDVFDKMIGIGLIGVWNVCVYFWFYKLIIMDMGV